MAVNRLLYLGLLVLSAVFYFASLTWFSWLLLVLLLAAPILSLLVSLPAMLSCRLDAHMPETVDQGAKAMLHLRLQSWHVLPLPEVQIRLNLRTRDREKDMRYLSRLSRTDGILTLPAEECGFLSAEFRRGRVYDLLGLFRLPMRLPNPKMQQLKAKPGGGSAEVHENRLYRPGDPVKDIHWKLSLKTDELIVREAQEPVKRKVILALRTPRGAKERAESLGAFRWLSHWLIDNGVVHTAVWVEDQRLRQLEIHSEADWMEALRSACLAPERSADLPWPLPIRADWICPVGRKGAPKA